MMLSARTMQRSSSSWTLTRWFGWRRCGRNWTTSALWWGMSWQAWWLMRRHWWRTKKGQARHRRHRRHQCAPRQSRLWLGGRHCDHARPVGSSTFGIGSTTSTTLDPLSICSTSSSTRLSWSQVIVWWTLMRRCLLGTSIQQCRLCMWHWTSGRCRNQRHSCGGPHV